MCQGMGSGSAGSNQAFNTAFGGPSGGAKIGGGQFAGGLQSGNGIYNRPFSYSPNPGAPLPHQFFEGTGPGGQPPPGPIPPTAPPPYQPPGGANPPGPPPTWTPPSDPGIRPPGGGMPPPGYVPPPVGTQPPPGQGANPPGGALPPPGSPGMTPPGMTPPPGALPPGNTLDTRPKMGGFGQGFRSGDGPPMAQGLMSGDGMRPNFNGPQAMGLQQSAPPMGVQSQPQTPPPPAQNPLLAALYSGRGGAFTPQQLNSYGAQSSNQWNPAAVSIAGSQAGFNTPAPMFQAQHLQNGDATMQNGQFTWTPQGLATMQANSGVK